jgi:hypothetical protein
MNYHQKEQNHFYFINFEYMNEKFSFFIERLSYKLINDIDCEFSIGFYNKEISLSIFKFKSILENIVSALFFK